MTLPKIVKIKVKVKHIHNHSVLFIKHNNMILSRENLTFYKNPFNIAKIYYLEIFGKRDGWRKKVNSDKKYWVHGPY